MTNSDLRINQFVAAASGLSRRAADAAIATGRVTHNGQSAHLGETVAAGDSVELDSRRLELPQTHTYLMLNKPVGYISSRNQQGSDPTLYDLLPAEYRTLRIVGRLDRDSSGLMLLTTDGPFVQRHTHPSYGKTKIYELTLDRPLSASAQAQLKHGVQLSDGPSHLIILENSGRHLRLSLSEGRNRQLRRTLGALGYGVTSLHRTHMGHYQLGDLPSGQWTIIAGEDTPS